MLSVGSKASETTNNSEVPVTCDAVRLGFELLNSVESLTEDVNEVTGKERESPSPDWNTEELKMEANQQHSPPLYPTENPTNQQQPKVQQMTDLSNCTVNTSNNNNTTTTNNNNNNSASNNMSNPLRIKHFAEHSDRELAELATQEISLDLQGLIDETHFPDDQLFGDLMDTAKKNDGMYGMGMSRNGGSVSTPGSSGQNSPGSKGQNSPPTYHNNHNSNYRNTFGYIPGSVHHGANYNHNQHHPHHPQVSFYFY